MMQRSRIFFSLILSAVALGPVLATASTVTGKIDILSVDKRASRRARNTSDVVVWLTPLHGSVHVEPEHAILIQRDKMFHPHTLVVPVGSVVDFPNEDPIYHNAFSNFDGQIFDVGLYPPGTNRPVKFSRPGVVRVFCNIHPSMSALIVVVDTPYYAKAAADGGYRIPNVPAGSYELHIFDERDTTGGGHPLTINVGDEEHFVAPDVRLSEAGYVQRPHKNKYGLDYPPNANEEGSYTGSSQ